MVLHQRAVWKRGKSWDNSENQQRFEAIWRSYPCDKKMRLNLKYDEKLEFKEFNASIQILLEYLYVNFMFVSDFGQEFYNLLTSVALLTKDFLQKFVFFHSCQKE